MDQGYNTYLDLPNIQKAEHLFVSGRSKYTQRIHILVCIIYTYIWLICCDRCIVNALVDIPCMDPMGYEYGMIQLDFPPHCGILGIVYLQSLKAKKYH